MGSSPQQILQVTLPRSPTYGTYQPSARQDCALSSLLLCTQASTDTSHFNPAISGPTLDRSSRMVITWGVGPVPPAEAWLNWSGVYPEHRDVPSFSGDTDEQLRLRIIGFLPARDNSHQPGPPYSLAQTEQFAPKRRKEF